MTLRTPTTVRPATAGDAAALAVLAQRTWFDAFGDAFAPTDVAADTEARRSETFFTAALADAVILLAVQDGAMVGYAMFGTVDTPEADAGPADRELHRLYVDGTRLRSGIGATLLRAALDHPELANAPRVFLNVWEHNEPAVALYRGFGFQRVGTTAFRIGSEVVRDALMMRPQLSTPSSR